MLFFSILAILLSCGNIYNPKERNKLVFNDSISSITDSINALNSILLSINRENYIYSINNNYLYINNKEQYATEIGLLSDSLIYDSKSFSFISPPDRKRFVCLITFLNRNYLSRCDIRNGQTMYMYRNDIYMADRQTDLFRFVVLANSEQEIDLIRYKIIDKYRNLYLLAYRDAKIWENEK